MISSEKHLYGLLAAMVGCVALGVSPAQAVVVTDYFTVSQSLTTPAGPTTVSDLTGTSIFGGDREMVVGKNSGIHNLNADASGGELSVGLVGGIDVDQGYVKLIWDGVGGSAGVVDLGGPAYDITQGGVNKGWGMTYRTNSGLGGSSYWYTTVSLYTDASNWISYSVGGPNFPGSGSWNSFGGKLELIGSGISKAGTVDFTQIRAISLQLTEPRSWDEAAYVDVLGLFFLGKDDSSNSSGGYSATTLYLPAGSGGNSGAGNGVTPVPEPGTVALLGGGLLGLLGYEAARRRTV